MTEDERIQMKNNLPSVLAALGLTNDSLNSLPLKGGRFKLSGEWCGLYKGRDGIWRWKSFESNKGGDTIDLLQEVYPTLSVHEAIAKAERFSTCCDSVKPQISSSPVQKKYAQTGSEIRMNNIRKLNEALRSATFHPQLTQALTSRGISTDLLPQAVLQKLGFVHNLSLISATSGNPYYITGVVFKLGNNDASFKIRKGQMNWCSFSFESSKYKCATIGGAALFMPEHLKQTDDPVFITEGEFDALAVMMAGCKAVSVPGVTSCRLLVDELKNLFAQGKKIPCLILAFDSDEPGRNGQEELKKELGQLGVTYSEFTGLSGYKDLNDLLQADPEKFVTEVTNAVLEAKTKFSCEVTEESICNDTKNPYLSEILDF